ncbi:disease resistance protein RGA2-like isoform X2 [Phragmites australis]|uniref:disease resistance protein RGA2-like isoform X2 n=1 Tax=Phragmites australis TaxID=29695 RepID=UPI002D768EF9|nr:disease resistance protein RGA2-like isoform X2 [Phragmites australis]
MTVREAVVEAAIGWLVESVMNLFTEKLVAWTHKVGLADDVEELKSAMRYVQMVLAAANGRKMENEPLAQSLSDLKGLLYDAEDVLDELDYYRLKEEVTSDNTATSSVWWFSSIIKQFGSTIIDKCGNFVSTGNSSRKRKREDDHKIAAYTQLGNKSNTEGGTAIAAYTYLENKYEFSRRIQLIAGKLRDVGHDVSRTLKIDVSNFVVTSSLSQSTPQDTRLTSSYLVEPKVYGRHSEMESILKLMASNRSNGITVLPIVGIGGIGKTTLAQLVYNDPIVTNQLQIKIWVCVSDNFNVVRLTREMLDCVSKQRQAETSNLNRLQEDLEKHMKSRRFLIVLDDVWDDMNEHSWNKLLAPLKRNEAMGNMILVTTRKLPVAEMTRTVEPIMLGALEGDDFWLLFESYAFGDQQYQDQRLYNIGKQIAQDLRGNPLAAKTVGALLRRDINFAYWTKIRKSEEWKSLQESEGIMSTLKLSYDCLPGHLQHCFRYCCLFPKDYQFDGADLVRIWISQGFVDGSRTSKSLEDTGNDYLADLVDSGFFQKIGRDWHSPECFVMHDLMHDLAWKVSRAELGTIDGRGCEEILPTVRHVSIVTDCTFSHENIKKKLRQIKSVRKLRSLLLIGHYDPSFFEDFQNMFKQAENLRLLRISATYADFVSFLHNLEYCTHLRYLKLYNKGSGEALPISLSKFYHLEVLDAGHPTIVRGMNDLISMRYLLVTKGARSSVTSVSKMSNHQDVQNFTDQNSSCSEIIQLQAMNKLVQLGVFQLENVSGAEAYGAKLRDKQHLQKLHLSWKDTLSQDESASDTSFEPSVDTKSEEESLAMDDSDPGSEPFMDIETEEDSSPMDDINNDQSSEHFIDTSREVLEGLEPHHNLKHLQISGYSGATSPAWLGTSVSCLQTLHLEDCGEWQMLPSLGRLLFLTKLKLRNMQKVTEAMIPSLEELVLIEMPKLERCSCNSVRDLNSSLRILNIQRCSELKVFPLFESCEKHKIEKKSWLSHLRELTFLDCPHLTISNPLPPSSSICKLSVARVSTVPSMEGSSNGKLIIGGISFDKDSDGLTNLDDKIVSFHNLRALTRLQIGQCPNLLSISLEGFRQLISLKSLEIDYCGKLFSSVVVPEHTHEYMADANFIALPSLKHLRINSCGITVKWLAVILKHVMALEELHLENLNISGLLIEGKESGLSHLTSAPRASSPGNRDDAMTSSTPDGLLRVPSKIIPSLKKMSIRYCRNLTFQMSKEGFAGFTSLEELTVWECPRLISSLVHKDENNDQGTGRWLLPHSLGKLEINHSTEILQPCFEENHTCLKKLQIWGSPSLKCLQLDSCTALEEMTIGGCGSLTALEGLQSLGSLRYLIVCRCPGLPPCLEHLSRGYELCPRLERLQIDDYSFLTESFCKHLTSLQRLELDTFLIEVTKLTDEQERALQLLTSLQELQFVYCTKLADLPVGLHSLPSLKSLEIFGCRNISRLPEKGLPPSLEELEIRGCSLNLTEQCRILASKLKVRIDGEYVH